MKFQEQERRSAVKGGERKTASQVKQAKGDGVPVSAPNESQTDVKMRSSPFDLSHTTSALSSPRPIHDLSRILYPEGISSPSAELNASAKGGKFRYDLDFLMQFQAVCKDKPHTLAPLHDIGLGFLDPSSPDAMTAASSGNRRKTRVLPVLVPPPARDASPIFGITSASGEVNNSPPKQRRPKRPTAWLAKLIKSASPEQVDSAVGRLLGRLNMENVDVICDDITWWVNKSEEEKDAGTLRQVVCLVVKNAADAPTRSDAYARLCHRMMTQISAKVRDDVTTNAQGKNVGGSLFHTWLLAKCQEHFDKDWNVKEEATAGPNVEAASSDETACVVNEKGEDGADEAEFASGPVSESDERQAAKQAKRLGLIRFIGELFRVRMIKDSIIHQYAKKLVDASNPADQRMEGLCELLKQIGSWFDTPKDRTKMDAYYRCMEEVGKNPDISPHIRSMLQDVQGRRWERGDIAAAKLPLAAAGNL